MELVERIPTKKIAFINSFDFKKFKQYTPSCKSDEERKTKFNMMRAFCQFLAIFSNGCCYCSLTLLGARATPNSAKEFT